MLQWLHTQPLKSSILKNRNLEQYFFFTFDNSCCCWYSYILQTAISKKWPWPTSYFWHDCEKNLSACIAMHFYTFFMKIIKKYGGLNMSYFAKKGLAANQSCNFFIFLRLCYLAVSYQIDFWIIFFLWGHNSKHELCFISVLDEILLNSSTASNSNFSIIERRFILSNDY